MIVIVDEAHGAHLGLSNRLPMTALEQGADIVIQSTHKTLPSLYPVIHDTYYKEKEIKIDSD